MLPIAILLAALILIYATRCIYKSVCVFLPFGKTVKIVSAALILIFAFAATILIGSDVLGPFINLVMLFTLTDILLLVLKLPFLRKINPAGFDGFGKVYGIFLILITFIISIFGYNTASNVHITHYTKEIHSKSFEDIRIMFVSDIHARETNYKRIADEIELTVEKERPDALIIGGDLVDNSSTKEHLKYFADTFHSISNQCTIMYVYGNHDLMTIDGIDAHYIENTLENCGVVVLNDESIDIKGISFIGRNEWFAKRQGIERKHISQLMPKDKSKATMVIDHQPKELEESQKAGVDLSVSGHTHNGQIFPLGSLCELFGINEMQYGRKDLGSYTAIVSSGVSTWGMNMRTQGLCEIVIVDIVSKP